MKVNRAGAINIAILSIVTFVYACTPDRLNEQELIQFLGDESNGLRKTEKVGSQQVSVTYRPVSLLVSQSVSDKTDTTEVAAAYKKYSPYYYFTVSFSDNGREALSPRHPHYGELVNVLSFRMHSYLNMTIPSRDTIPMADFVLNRTFGMASSTDMLVVFSKDKTRDQEWVQINLQELGLGLGNQRFRFLTADIESCPWLKDLPRP
jgi:hypothetical protein